jgi:uncharacterized protein
MLRTSSYVIYVELTGNSEEMLLVHGYTGAYDKVSRQVAEHLLSREAGPPPLPLYGQWTSEPAVQGGTSSFQPSDSTLEVLQRRGYLTSLTVEEEQGHLARTAKKLHRHATERGPSYLFMPTYQCNLRCPYCFQDHMRTNPEFQHLLRTMTPAMVDRILATWPGLERNHGIEEGEEFTRTVGLYGGEPFLAENRPIIEYIIGRVRELGPASFWAVSNATQLDAYADLLGPDGIASIQITIDGPPELHDKRRIHADGSGSFAQIARNVDLCLDRGVKVQIRMNVDRENVNHLPFVADEFVARGWDKRRGFMVYTARIAPANDQTHISTTFNTTWELDEAIDELRAVHANMRIIGRPDDGLQLRAYQHVHLRLLRRHLRLLGAHRGFKGAHWARAGRGAGGDERWADSHVAQPHPREQPHLPQVPICIPLRRRLRRACRGAERKVLHQLLRRLRGPVPPLSGAGIHRLRRWHRNRAAGTCL